MLGRRNHALLLILVLFALLTISALPALAGSADLEFMTAVVIGAIVVVAALAVAVRRLETVELRGETA